jgi:hypothetical protein
LEFFTFINDVESLASSTNEYFLGMIFVKNDSGRRDLIVDGQQRITSFSLILKSLLDISKYKELISDNVYEEYIKNFLKCRNEKNKVKFMNMDNQDSLHHILTSNIFTTRKNNTIKNKDEFIKKSIKINRTTKPELGVKVKIMYDTNLICDSTFFTVKINKGKEEKIINSFMKKTNKYLYYESKINEGDSITIGYSYINDFFSEKKSIKMESEIICELNEKDLKTSNILEKEKITKDNRALSISVKD